MTKWQIGSMAKWHNCIMVLWKEVLTFEILDVSDDDDVEELVVGDVGGPDRHHQVPEADERTVLVSEHSHDDVVLKKKRIPIFSGLCVIRLRYCALVTMAAFVEYQVLIIEIT